LGRWKWVIVYTILLFATLTQTRRFLDWLVQRNLGGLQAYFLFFAAIGCLALLVRHIRRTQGGFSLSSGLRLVAFVALYLGCMFLSTDLTVDRIHFVEYGILGFLCFRAVRSEHGPVRRAAYAMVAVFAIGFLDEAIQGLLANRYYALRDIVIDLMAGFLPILGILLWPLPSSESREIGKPIPRKPEPSSRIRASDGWALLLTAFLVAGLLWVGRVSWDLEPLYGDWERQNRCGQIERVRIVRDATVQWEEEAGGRAKGRYQIRGNRLDGPLLEMEVLEAKGEGPCAWTAGEERHRYFRVNTETLLFTKEPEYPFRRVGSG
jgi:hypothetical protein